MAKSPDKKSSLKRGKTSFTGSVRKKTAAQIAAAKKNLEKARAALRKKYNAVTRKISDEIGDYKLGRAMGKSALGAAVYAARYNPTAQRRKAKAKRKKSSGGVGIVKLMRYNRASVGGSRKRPNNGKRAASVRKARTTAMKQTAKYPSRANKISVKSRVSYDATRRVKAYVKKLAKSEGSRRRGKKKR